MTTALTLALLGTAIVVRGYYTRSGITMTTGTLFYLLGALTHYVAGLS